VDRTEAKVDVAREKALKAAGKTLEAATLGEMEDAWIAAKLRGF
jgi:hypothetical protein